ncbi:MAG: malonyl-[acyl-carrier protein] O-methyltransferase BioC [Candidatus Electrothrix sp. AW1]|nr:malonyl-[acyl-carrier protein] O-methyltransferase BioC [Candidatus Electrothrix sp. AX1]MCI5182377.1 malonyl-[acyl-carrier protein] O-methyltransferase BioC [Candidatus Electrothrix gigas]
MQKIDKQLVCRQFRRAAASYDRQATIQHRVADRLLTMTARYMPQRPLRVLEIGCCTGLLTKKILKNSKINISSLVLNDLIPDFAKQLPKDIYQSYQLIDKISDNPFDKLSFLPGDIEQLSLPGSFDLIISSSTLHWLDDLQQTLTKLLDALRPQGILAFSLYGPDNLPEIKELTGVSLHYLSLHEIASILEKQGLLLESFQEKEVFLFSTPWDVLQHLRQTGVNAIHRTPWTRKELRTFCQEYSKQFSMTSVDQAVRLTYHPLYFVARPS